MADNQHVEDIVKCQECGSRSLSRDETRGEVVCDDCGLGAHIYQATLPIAVETRQVADEMEEDVDKYAYFGGEDAELLFTLTEEDADRLFHIFKDFTVIGRMTDSETSLVIQTAEGDVLSFDDMKA